MLGNLKNLYDCLPKKFLFFLKNTPDSILFGKSYTQWKSKISFDKNLFDIHLAETLNYAREHTLYGKDHIPLHVDANNARSILESLPLVTSYDIATDLAYYTSDEFNLFNSYLTTTGGTGRNPTTILLSNELYGIEWAHVHHIWSFAGYERKRDVKLTLRGKMLRGSKLVELSPIHNELIVDIYKVNHKNFKDFLEIIKDYDIKYIHGYPSLVKQYMEFFQENNYHLKLKGVFLTSEGATVEEKKKISDFFSCKVISFYGHSERAIIAVDNEANGIYKVYSSYGYPRIVDGELVVTSFVNRAMPLINFCMGDGAELIEDEHSFYLKNITSRRGKDFLYFSKDNKISVTLLAMHTEVENDILYYQFHQKEFGKVEIRLLQKTDSTMPTQKLSEKFAEAIQKELKDFIIDVKIVSENEIIKSHKGKMILLVQELEK